MVGGMCRSVHGVLNLIIIIIIVGVLDDTPTLSIIYDSWTMSHILGGW